ncbi:MAG: glycosyltransferase [Hyphomonadaceae bacterium]|nr:glycosyltransferase [Hyphomonadaceae bacterium]
MIRCYQVSAAHVYLTYPFVLSWSMMEAMSAGCLVIGADVEPVREMIDDGQEGVLVPFFDTEALANQVTDALQLPEKYAHMRIKAREKIVENMICKQCVCRPNWRFIVRF